MATRKLEVVITGDASSLEKSLNNVGTQSTSMASKFKKLAVVGGVVGGAMAGVGLALGKTVAAAQESEKAQARLDQALKGAGLSMDQYGSQIQANIDKTSRLAALDDEELSDAFAKLVRTTGDVTKATEGMNLAADIARSRNVSLETATKAVERAMNGSSAGLAKFGIAVAKSTENVDAAKATIDSWRDSNGKLTDSEDTKAKALLEGAKAMDKQATAGNALDAAQKKFAGGAEAYGKTSAAAQERVSVALENLQEIIGAKVLPVVALLSEKLLAFINWSIVNWPRFQQAVNDAMVRARQAFETVRPVVEAIQQVIEGLVTMVVALFRGDWSKAWEGFKQVVTGALKAVVGLIELQFTVFRRVATELGEAIIEGVKAGLTGIGMAAWGIITNINDRITEFEETIKGWGKSVALSIVGGVTGALVGIGTKAWEVINNIGSVLDDVRQQIIGWGKGLANRVINGIKEGLSGIGQLIWEKIKDGWDWAMRQLDKLPGPNPFGSEVGKNPTPVSSLPTSSGVFPVAGVTSDLWDEAALGRLAGLSVTSGLRPGDPGDHGKGRALDMAGSFSGMAAFAQSLFGRPGIKDVIYGELPVWQDNGRMVYGWANNEQLRRDHAGANAHVHFSTFDKGGWLMPGLTLARNMTGRPERILGPGQGGNTYITVNMPNYVGDKREAARAIKDELQALDRVETGGRTFNSRTVLS